MAAVALIISAVAFLGIAAASFGHLVPVSHAVRLTILPLSGGYAMIVGLALMAMKWSSLGGEIPPSEVDEEWSRLCKEERERGRVKRVRFKEEVQVRGYHSRAYYPKLLGGAQANDFMQYSCPLDRGDKDTRGSCGRLTEPSSEQYRTELNKAVYRSLEPRLGSRVAKELASKVSCEGVQFISPDDKASLFISNRDLQQAKNEAELERQKE